MYDHYGELQVLLETQVAIKNGELNIEFLRDTYLTDTLQYGLERPRKLSKKIQFPFGEFPYDYRSGWIETTEKYYIKINTYTEIVCKIPSAYGFWGGPWLFGGPDGDYLKNYEEIDLAEQ